jgi:stage V sporulation protein D (sporulation-specific penicillin-binding protein)
MVSKYSHSRRTPTKPSIRHKIVILGIYFGLFIILSRLFYWQIIQGSDLKSAALDQYQRTLTQQGQRGKIYTSDDYLLVGNATKYHLVAYPHLLEKNSQSIANTITPLVINDLESYQEASEEAKREEIKINLINKISQRLDKKQAKWVSLSPNLSEETKNSIDLLEIAGLDFESNSVRFYPEASMAAHLTGFIAKDDQGLDVGYFGVEGALNKELSGKKRKITLSTDALGFSLFGQKPPDITSSQGRDITLTIRRNIQLMVETMLQEGMELYGAKAGEVVVLAPQTGKILALAAEPKYDQQHYHKYDSYLYKNPLLIDLFEPGSILKTLTVAAGIDTQAITPETECPRCDGPITIGKYTIRTWNNEYSPQITMRDALAKSDNTAMIFIAEEMGNEVFREYLQNFGIGEELDVDLHGDNNTPFPEKWGPVELATRSFGQGITATSLQMVRAVATIANHGRMMQPQIVEKVVDPDGQEIEVKPKEIREVISRNTAEQVTEMMVHAAKSGEAQWTYSQTHTVAAKTGTSQIPGPGGGYEDDATIASFIGFAPPQDPQFLMLVKLIEPQSSPWAAETAAPLWYQIAEKLFLSLNIPPDQQ